MKQYSLKTLHRGMSIVYESPAAISTCAFNIHRSLSAIFNVHSSDPTLSTVIFVSKLINRFSAILYNIIQQFTSLSCYFHKRSDGQLPVFCSHKQPFITSSFNHREMTKCANSFISRLFHCTLRSTSSSWITFPRI